MRSGGRAHEMQELRSLMALTPDAVRDIVNGTRTADEREQAVAVLQKLQARAARFELEPEPGYQPGYLELLDEPGLRAGVKAIADAHFSPAPDDSYGDALRNTRLLARWITAPMGDVGQARREPCWTTSRRSNPGPSRTCARSGGPGHPRRRDIA